jgi:hypothetical protein
MQPRPFTWLIISNPTFIPMIITGVAIASANSALGEVMVNALNARYRQSGSWIDSVRIFFFH